MVFIYKSNLIFATRKLPGAYHSLRYIGQRYQCTSQKYNCRLSMPEVRSYLLKPLCAFLKVNHPSIKTNLHLSRYLSTENKNIPEEDDIQDVFIGEGSWQEVYKGVLTTQFKLLKMFSLSTSVIGLSVQPILYEKLGSVNLGIFLGLGSFIGVFTFVTPALIHWVSKKYVTKLEYDPQTDFYAATTLSFFLKEKKIHFRSDDVIRPVVPGMFTSFIVDGRPLFVDPSMFENEFHYARIMGFDKPLDISLERDKNKN